MLEKQNKMPAIIAAIATPFAVAAVILLSVLSFLEYFRRGFVSLFLDFRILAGATLVLWVVAGIFNGGFKRAWPAAVLALGLLGGCLFVVWQLAFPYGRLGLGVFAGAAAGAAIVMFSIMGKRDAAAEVQSTYRSTLDNKY